MKDTEKGPISFWVSFNKKFSIDETMVVQLATGYFAHY
jgi:hypothetical protein